MSRKGKMIRLTRNPLYKPCTDLSVKPQVIQEVQQQQQPEEQNRGSGATCRGWNSRGLKTTFERCPVDNLRDWSQPQELEAQPSCWKKSKEWERESTQDCQVPTQEQPEANEEDQDQENDGVPSTSVPPEPLPIQETSQPAQASRTTSAASSPASQLQPGPEPHLSPDNPHEENELRCQSPKPSQVQHSPRDLFKTPATAKRKCRVPRKSTKTSSEPLEEPMHWEVSKRGSQNQEEKQRASGITRSRSQKRYLGPQHHS